MELLYGTPSAGNRQQQRSAVFTLKLKSSLTKQTLDAVGPYRRDRNPREKLFKLGRSRGTWSTGVQDGV